MDLFKKFKVTLIVYKFFFNFFYCKL